MSAVKRLLAAADRLQQRHRLTAILIAVIKKFSDDEAGNRAALIAESADVLYHLIVMWVDAGLAPEEVWAELVRREGVSGIAEKAGRAARLSIRHAVRTRKIP